MDRPAGRRNGGGSVAVTADLCPRCVRRYRASEPLDCEECEIALRRSRTGEIAEGSAGNGSDRTDGTAGPVTAGQVASTTSDGGGGSTPGRTTVQRKLEVSDPADPAEREAERIADRVMAASVGGSSRTDRRPASGPDDAAEVAERDDGAETAERDDGARATDRDGSSPPRGGATGPIDRRVGDAGSGGTTVSGDLERRIRSSGPGRPLPDSTRSFFEGQFGVDLGGVRVHTGTEAARLSRRLDARAFTHGTDVFFGRGEYAPGTREGRRLVAHELTHVVQQRGAVDRIARQELGPGHDYPGCTPDVTGLSDPVETLEDARRTAIGMADRSIAEIRSMIAGETPSPAAAQALERHFDRPNARQMRTILSTFRGARRRLDLKYRIICNTADSAICRGNTLGYAWSSGGPYIHLCPQGLSGANQDWLERAITLLHEAAHVAGADADTYVHEDEYSELTAAEAAENADSYAHFGAAVRVEGVGGGSPGTAVQDLETFGSDGDGIDVVRF